MNRTEHIQHFSGTNKRYEDKYLNRVHKVLIPVGLMSAIQSGGIRAGIAFLHQWVSNERLTDVIEPMYLDIGLRYARMNEIRQRKENKGAKALGVDALGNLVEYKAFDDFETKRFGFNEAWTNFIKNYLSRFLIEKITFKVSAETRNGLLKYLNQAITEGWSIDRTVKEIEDLPFLKYQAARIVRTEVNRAANVGIAAQAKTFPYQQMKEWISAEDKRVRGTNIEDHASHVALDGMKINEDDVFKDPRNGDLLEFPCDPNGSAESTINCRCTHAYTAKRDASGRLIPKRVSTSVIFPNQNVQRFIQTI